MSTIEIPPYCEGHAVILLTVGLPASGKSTFARELVTSEPNRWKRINRDDVRLMLHGAAHNYTNKSHEKAVTEICNASLREMLRSSYDVILDNTHLSSGARKAIHTIAEELGECTVIEKLFPVSVEECLNRNRRREGIARVPDSVILSMAKKIGVTKDGRINNLVNNITTYSNPKPIVQDENLPPAVICDLDGTIALMNGRNPYDASRCEEDSVNQPVLDVLESLSDGHLGDNVIFMSGRSDKYRPETERWLRRYVRSPRLYSYELFMRAEGDMRKDSIVKKELFEKHVLGKYWIRLVLDDRSSVVKMWRSLGLSCFQVAEGNF